MILENLAIPAGHNYNVPKSMEIPAGATHYDHALVHKFFKVVDKNEKYQYRDGDWVEINKHPVHGWGCLYLKLIEPIIYPKTIKYIDTIFGKCVLLESGMVDPENNPFSYRPICLLQSDILR